MADHIDRIEQLLAECVPIVTERKHIDAVKAAALALRIKFALRAWPPKR